MAALYLKNRIPLFNLISGVEYAAVESEGAEDIPVDRTISLIDAFLKTLPTENLSLEAEGAAAVDYVSTLKFDKNSGRKFVKVKTKLLIDGDTSHFYIEDADKAQFPEGQLIRQDGVL